MCLVAQTTKMTHFCLDGEVAEIRSAVVNEVNELGETPLATTMGKDHLEVIDSNSFIYIFK